MFVISSCRDDPSAAAGRTGETAPWAVELAALDPAFGGRAAVVAWVDRGPLWTWRGEPRAREAAMTRFFGELDEAALARCRAQLDPVVAEAALAFLRTDAGQAMIEAELLAMSTFGWHYDDLPTRLAAWLGDPGRVGPHAQEVFREATESVMDGGSGSPMQLALVLAARVVGEAEAGAIGAFLATDRGAAWLAGRTNAWPEARDEGRRALRKLADAGFARNATADAMDDLILPRAEFSAPATAEGTIEGTDRGR